MDVRLDFFRISVPREVHDAALDLRWPQELEGPARLREDALVDQCLQRPRRLEDCDAARDIVVCARPWVIEVAGVVDHLAGEIRTGDPRGNELVKPFLVARINLRMKQDVLAGRESLLQLACLAQ